MHELRLASSIVDTVCARAEGARVVRVRVRVGRLAAVLPDALRFGFEVATRGTVAEGARLEIEELPAVARCRACAAELELDGPVGRCACGGEAFDWIRGDELVIRDMELI